MRVLFLDIDGVLNSRSYVERASWDPPLGSRDDLHILDPAAIALLNTVLAATGAVVVISSSWRVTYALDAFQSMFEQRGFTGRVVDVTPQLPGRQRSREIAAWLEATPNVVTFAIVDDIDDAGVGYAEQFVQTTFESGLTPYHARELARILNREK